MLAELREVLDAWDAARDRMAESARLFAALLAGRRPERIPIAVGTTQEAFYLGYLGVTMGQYRSDPAIALRAELKALGWRLREFPEEDVTEASLSVPIVSECNAIVASAYCDVLHFPDRVGYKVFPALASIADARKLKVPRPQDVPAVQRLTRFVEHFRRELDGRLPVSANVPIMPYTDAAMIRGDEALVLDLIDSPRDAHLLLEIVVETEVRFIQHVRRLLGQSEPEAGGIADDATCYLSPQLFAEFAIPYQKMALKALTTSGRANGVHLCGPSMHLLPIVKRELDPGAMLISYAGDLGRASEIMGSTILRGNVDPAVLVEGSREEIREAVWRSLAAGAQRDRYCFSSGTETWHTGTPIENIHYAYSVVKGFDSQCRKAGKWMEVSVDGDQAERQGI